MAKTLPLVALWLAGATYVWKTGVQLPTSVVAFRLLTAQNQLAVAGLAVLSAILLATVVNNVLYDSNPLGRTTDLVKTFARQEKSRKIEVNGIIDRYNELHNDDKHDVTQRNSNYTTLVNAYYELATLFYEWGWGQSFHFAYERSYETFQQAIRRHEYYLAGRLGVSTGAKVLDVGCGIGGPMRNIAEFTGANITGITINEYQVLRGNELNAARGLKDQCRSVQGDFMQLPFEANTFDGVYAIEATCHAPRREGVYGEILRVLKPGCVFACYEWCLTDKYDPNNAEHRDIKKKIEEGDGLPDMARTHECVQALRSVGFEIIETRDKVVDSDPKGRPWYLPLTPSYNILSQRFQFTPIGMWLTTNVLWFMEKVKLAPQGTSKVQTMLQQGGMGCARGGETGTFTPMFLMVARKPLN